MTRKEVLDILCALYFIPDGKYDHIPEYVLRDIRDADAYRKLKSKIIKETREENDV